MSVTRNLAGFAGSVIKYFAVFIAAIAIPLVVFEARAVQLLVLMVTLYLAAWYGKREFGLS